MVSSTPSSQWGESPASLTLLGLAAYAHMVRPTVTKFGMVNCRRGVWVCYMGQPCPHPQQPGPVTSIFWDHPHACTHRQRSSNKILHGDRIRCQENCYRVNHTPCPTKNWSL